ncbi:MAG: acyl-CoA thioesterase [Methylothermaceae bacteria B42]|nr:MAG: acyl-CoA thioesterase [Methylothermaceae bacteria B42]HHJ40490.1 acyl-CoA thioesterase [Methylothermaceae bacterium]
MPNQEKSLHMTVLMTPDMANFAGKVHGGALLKLLDQVAYACAARYCGSYVVTAALDMVFFKEPIHVGELVTFKAHINYTGRTSMEVGIKVIAEDITSRSKRHTTSCYFTMVAKDEQGRSIPVPPLELETDLEKRRHRAAQIRRTLRKEAANKIKTLHTKGEI